LQRRGYETLFWLQLPLQMVNNVFHCKGCGLQYSCAEFVEAMMKEAADASSSHHGRYMHANPIWRAHSRHVATLGGCDARCLLSNYNFRRDLPPIPQQAARIEEVIHEFKTDWPDVGSYLQDWVHDTTFENETDISRPYGKLQFGPFVTSLDQKAEELHKQMRCATVRMWFGCDRVRTYAWQPRAQEGGQSASYESMERCPSGF